MLFLCFKFKVKSKSKKHKHFLSYPEAKSEPFTYVYVQPSFTVTVYGLMHVELVYCKESSCKTDKIIPNEISHFLLRIQDLMLSHSLCCSNNKTHSFDFSDWFCATSAHSRAHGLCFSVHYRSLRKFSQ